MKKLNVFLFQLIFLLKTDEKIESTTPEFTNGLLENFSLYRRIEKRKKHRKKNTEVFTFLLPFLYLVLSFKIPVINSEAKLFFKQRAVKKNKTNSKEIWIYLFVKIGKKLQVGPGFLKLSNFQNVPHTYQSFFGISGSFRITYGIYAQVWRLVGRTWFNLQ